jgi:hypothetical protein
MAYFSNSSEGDVLESQCRECPLSDVGCPVLNVQTAFNYEQLNPGNEKLRSVISTLVNDSGECQIYKKLLISLKPLLDGAEALAASHKPPIVQLVQSQAVTISRRDCDVLIMCDDEEDAEALYESLESLVPAIRDDE